MKAAFVLVMNGYCFHSVFLSLFDRNRDIPNTCSTDTNRNFDI